MQVLERLTPGHSFERYYRFRTPTNLNQPQAVLAKSPQIKLLRFTSKVRRLFNLLLIKYCFKSFLTLVSVLNLLEER
jgi:hypothetical protein